MNVDRDDLDNGLVQQMSCLATDDRETLIRQFQAIIGAEQIPQEMCAFFLDMSNWNIQEALGAYYDHGQANNISEMAQTHLAALNMQLVSDVTIGEGESVPPSTVFRKTWRVRNNGEMHWPEGTVLCYMEGDCLTAMTCIPTGCVPPNQEVELSVDMQSPGMSGLYSSRWQLNTYQRIPFGESIWCIITVDANGILGITQQMASTPLGGLTHRNPQNTTNPFQSVMQGPSNLIRDQRQQNSENGMDTDVVQLSSQLNRLVRSNPVEIAKREGTDVPPSTPCTPPENFKY